MKIRHDLEEMKDEYMNELKTRRENKAAVTSTDAHYNVKSRNGSRNRSGTPIRSQRKQSPDTYSIYKRNDEIQNHEADPIVPDYAEADWQKHLRDLRS